MELWEEKLIAAFKALDAEAAMLIVVLHNVEFKYLNDHWWTPHSILFDESFLVVRYVNDKYLDTDATVVCKNGQLESTWTERTLSYRKS